MDNAFTPSGYYTGQGAALMPSTQTAFMPTMKQRLEAAVVQAEERLEQAKRAREIFDKNPDLEELINILNRSQF